MSDGSLSQDEIDALLQGVDDMAPQGGPAPPAAGGDTGVLSDQEKNDFMGIIDQQLTTASNTLTTIVSKKVEMPGPNIEIKSPDDLRAELTGEYIQIRVDYTEGIAGETLFLLKKNDGAIIADLMMGQEGKEPPADLNDLYLSALGEALSQVNSAGLNIISDKIDRVIKTAPPKVEVVTDPAKIMLPSGDKLVSVSSSLNVEGLITSNLIQIYPIPFIKEITGAPAGEGVSFDMAPQAAPAAPAAAAPSGPAPDQVKVQQAQFPPLNIQGAAPEQHSNIQLLMDVPMQLTVELGRTRMLVQEILGLGEGSIIELDKLAGEPVDLLINNKLIAKGEVVVIDENFGVRVTDIINPVERVMHLQEG